MFEERPSPIIASAASARKLPRLALLALLILFIIPGLLSRDFWSSHEISIFAVALTMINGSGVDWMLPNIDGVAYYTSGPLTAWVAAIFAKLFGWLFGIDSAARLSVLAWFAMGTASVWYGTWYLARRDEAQPVALAFGGQADPRDYGRVVADAALLLFIATFGLFVPIREMVADAALLAVTAGFFFSLAWTFTRPLGGPLLTGVMVSTAILVSDLFSGCVLLLIALIIHARFHAYETPFIMRATSIVVSAAALFFIWPVLAVGIAIETVDAWFAAWWNAQLALFSGISLSAINNAVKNCLWFLWPLWPFVLFSLYAFRKQLDRTHIKLPLWISAGLAFFGLTGNISGDHYLMILTPTLSVLAAFGLLSSHRSRASMLDWFSATVFTLALATLWAYYIAWNLGWPPKMAKSVINLAPGIEPTVHGLLFVLCFVTLLAWLTLVLWRMNRKQVVAWKGPWLAAAGVTALSLTCVYLFGPAIDNARSYAPIAQAASLAYESESREGDCLSTHTLDPAKRVLFNFYGLSLSSNAQCRFNLERVQNNQDEMIAYHFEILGLYNRPRDHETFALLKNN